VTVTVIADVIETGTEIETEIETVTVTAEGVTGIVIETGEKDPDHATNLATKHGKEEIQNENGTNLTLPPEMKRGTRIVMTTPSLCIRSIPRSTIATCLTFSHM